MESKITPDMAKALFDFQNSAPKIKLDSEVSFGQTKFKYASLGNILEQIRPVMEKCKLTHVQLLNGLEVITRIIHSETGDFIESRLLIEANKDPKNQGAAITYARRYSLVSALGIVADDDKDAPEVADEKPVLTEPYLLKAIEKMTSGEQGIIDRVLASMVVTSDQVRRLIEAEDLLTDKNG